MNMLMATFDGGRTATVPDGCPLTPREYEVLQLLADGKRYTQIGLTLKLAPSTVRQHCHNAYLKLGVTDRVGAVLYALNAGWITANGRGHAHHPPILDQLATLDDRGLEHAESLLHEHRQRYGDDYRLDRALRALDQVRAITKPLREYDRDWTDELRNDRRIT